MEFQHTIKNEVTFEGIGVHTAQQVKMRLLPANEKFGIRFKRIDIEGEPEVKALADFVTDTQRSTTIEKGKAKVQTIEHIMAALYALGVDNVLIEMNGGEVPIYDGSAIEFVREIKKIGLQKQTAEREIFNLDNNISFSLENSSSEVIALPFNGFKASVNIKYPVQLINNQMAKISDFDEFEKEVAPARTFCLLSELMMLVKHNLVKGGNTQNAIVFVDELINENEVNQLKNQFNLSDVEIEKNKLLNNELLKFSNEPARHKLLDFLGDLALCGYKINARFFVDMPGHTINTAFAKHIRSYISQKKHLLQVPIIDLNSEPIFDIHQIEKMLPHRYPFLLVDKIMKLTDKEVVGVKNVTFNEEFFQGHFPGNAIMPGVLQIEAMAQTGGILALSTVEDPHNYWTFFLKIDQAKFKKPVRPGDTAIFELKLLKPIRRGIVEMKARTFVKNQLTTEAILTAQIVKK